MIPALELTGITAERGGRRVLDGLSLSLLPGARLALTGRNGAGKSSLLRLIAGLDLPVAGQLALFGTPCRNEADFRPQRLKLGLLFQDPDDQLVGPTVLEDTAFGPLNQGLGRAAALARARDELARFGIAALEARPVAQLSVGEKRLVCLAGIFAMAPQLVLLDEPESGLDEAGATRLIARLEGWEGTLLAVTHDPGFARRMGAGIGRLEQGRVELACRTGPD